MIKSVTGRLPGYNGIWMSIAFTQLKYIFGYNILQSDHITTVFRSIVRGIEDFDYKTFIMGMTWIAILMLMKFVGRQYKKLSWMKALGPLTVTVLGIVLNVAFKLEDEGIAVVGTIPQDFPNFSAHDWTIIHDFKRLYLVVITVVMVGFTESMPLLNNWRPNTSTKSMPVQSCLDWEWPTC
jgi:sulfate transporter 4